jgi:4-carboxymuconolactone decarboxylase
MHSMTTPGPSDATLRALDDETRSLVVLAADVAVGNEERVRTALAEAGESIRPTWVEELLLQTYLFAGFPRALNAMREWRRVSGRSAPRQSAAWDPEAWRTLGEATCARVYGEMYGRLRTNIRELHPELDEWMIVEGYGKVLSRPELDLGRRELCIVAVCMASQQDRQLHSHLHGALNAGVAPNVVSAALEALEPVVGPDRAASARMLWARVRGK